MSLHENINIIATPTYHASQRIIYSTRVSLPMSPMAMKKRSKETFGTRIIQYKVNISFFLFTDLNQSLYFTDALRRRCLYLLETTYFETLQLNSVEMLIQKL